MRKILRKARRLARAIYGKDLFIGKQIEIDMVRMGSEYGGWNIVDQNLTGDSVIYSFGVGEDASFDLSLIDHYGATVHAFDPTPKSIEWVRNQKMPDEFKMHEYGVADFDGVIDFNPPKNANHVSYTIMHRPETSDNCISVPVKNVSTILGELGHDHIDLLKMDIEGAEYRVIDFIIKSSIRPRQLLIEFHHRFPNVGIEKTRHAIELLNSVGYKIFHVSDTGEEFSFLYVG